MNKTKRNLILASAIINLIQITSNLIVSILLLTNYDLFKDYLQYYYGSYSTSIVYSVISFAAGLVGSILLFFAVRSKGKYFSQSRGLYIAGFIIIVVCGGWLPWLLLFISMFISDVVVMNSKSEIRREERAEAKEEILKDQAYDEKKKAIEDLKRLRDNGLISEEEYKQKLFELL